MNCGSSLRTQGRAVTPGISRRFLEKLPAGQPGPERAGAGDELVKLGVAQQPGGRIVVDVTVAAEQLDRVERALRRLLGCIENGAGCILARGLGAGPGFRPP